MERAASVDKCNTLHLQKSRSPIDLRNLSFRQRCLTRNPDLCMSRPCLRRAGCSSATLTRSQMPKLLLLEHGGPFCFSCGISCFTVFESMGLDTLLGMLAVFGPTVTLRHR